MKTLVWEDGGMQVMAKGEAALVAGGISWKSVVRGTLWFELTMEVVRNWDDIKAGFVDGWNIDNPKK